MKNLLFTVFLMLSALNIFAQKNNDIAINGTNIDNTLIGKWTMTNVQPSDKGVMIKGFTMKGVGFGEILKSDEEGTAKTLVSKIFSINNNSIIFSDEEGTRIVYKVLNLTKSTIRLFDGTCTIDFKKE